MDRHQEILIRAIKDSRLTAREIAAMGGIHESTLSKFLDGKSDLKAGNYFKILSVLPLEQRLAVQKSLGMVVDTLSKSDENTKGLLPLVQMIEIANDDEMEAAMMAIGRKWKRLRLAIVHTEDVNNPMAMPAAGIAV